MKQQETIKIEKALLGAVMREKNIPDGFTSELFFHDKNKRIALEMIADNTDYVTLITKFDAVYLSECVIEGNGLISASKGVELLEIELMKRGINDVANRAMSKLGAIPPSEIAGSMAIEAMNIVEQRPKEKTKASEVLKEIDAEQTEYVISNLEGRKTIGIPTGYRIFDDKISGLRPAHLIVISAYTNVGKTMFALNIARNVLNQGKRVVFISLEMSRRDIVGRLIAIEGCLPLSGIVSAGTDNEAYREYLKTSEKIGKMNFRVYSEKHELNEILMVMRAEEKREHVDLFILDYLQNIIGEGSEYELMTRSVRELQATLSKIGSTCIAISQISNDNRKANALEVNGKGSGAIRAASDLFLFLNYEDNDDDVIRKTNEGIPLFFTAYINKNRHGLMGTSRMVRDPMSGQMQEV